MYKFCGTISKFKDETTMYEKLYIILKNIAPTSVSSEQAFSVGGSIVPNRRSRLSDESIDDLCFEKAILIRMATREKIYLYFYV